jgi:hypothetical protein
MGIGCQLLHRGGRRRARASTWTSSASAWPTARAAGAPDRQGGAADLGADPGAGPRDHVRPDRRRGAGHLARTTSRSCHGDTATAAVSAWHLRSRSTRCPARPPPSWREGRERPRIVGRGDARSADDLEWTSGRFHVRVTRRARPPGDRLARTRTRACPRASRATWTPRVTTRRT